MAAIINSNYFSHSTPHSIISPYDDLTLFFDEKARHELRKTILTFEKEYLTLSIKYGFGVPFHAFEKIEEIEAYWNNYEKIVLSKTNLIGFFLLSFNGVTIKNCPTVALLKIANNDLKPMISENEHSFENYSSNIPLKLPPIFETHISYYDKIKFEDSQDISNYTSVALDFGLSSNFIHPTSKEKIYSSLNFQQDQIYYNAHQYNLFLNEIYSLANECGLIINTDPKDFFERRPYESSKGITNFSGQFL